jgi:serine O-acetyltransferase
MNNYKNISASTPDWSRESKPFGAWDPGRTLLKSIRNYQAWKLSPILKFFTPLAVVRHRFWSAVAGADIPLNCQLGGGLLIPHPNGIVILPAATIGVNCLIFQQVTIGSNGHGNGQPVVGGHVDIGAGAKILGGVVGNVRLTAIS